MYFLNSFSIKIMNLFRGTLKDKIFFLHVPKCGGTSLDITIRKRYPTLDPRENNIIASLSASASSDVIKMVNQTHYPHDTKDDYPIMKLRENLLLYFMNQNKYKFITGHFPFSKIAHRQFKDEYAFITILRDPVKRWLSSYFYNRFKSRNHRKIEEDIIEHLESPFGLSQGHEYVKFIGGADPTGDYSSKQAIDRAKNNLHNFDIVGLLEYQKEFFEQIYNRFGIRLKLENKNKSPASTSYRKSQVTEEINKQIIKICEPDNEIYQYAVDNFLKIKTH